MTKLLSCLIYVLNVNENIQVENVNDVDDGDLPIMMDNLKWLMKLECKQEQNLLSMVFNAFKNDRL